MEQSPGRHDIMSFATHVQTPSALFAQSASSSRFQILLFL